MDESFDSLHGIYFEVIRIQFHFNNKIMLTKKKFLLRDRSSFLVTWEDIIWDNIVERLGMTITNTFLLFYFFF